MSSAAGYSRSRKTGDHREDTKQGQARSIKYQLTIASQRVMAIIGTVWPP